MFTLRRAEVIGSGKLGVSRCGGRWKPASNPQPAWIVGKFTRLKMNNSLTVQERLLDTADPLKMLRGFYVTCYAGLLIPQHEFAL